MTPTWLRGRRHGLLVGIGIIILGSIFLYLEVRASRRARVAATKQTMCEIGVELASSLVDGDLHTCSQSSGNETVPAKDMYAFLVREGTKHEDMSWMVKRYGTNLLDAWGSDLNFLIDLDQNGIVRLGGTSVREPIVIWSSGPNKQNENGAGDDIVYYVVVGHQFYPK